MNTEFIINNYMIESFSLGFIAGLTVAFIIICAIYFSKCTELSKTINQEG